jgi:hypothetical protein
MGSPTVTESLSVSILRFRAASRFETATASPSTKTHLVACKSNIFLAPFSPGCLIGFAVSQNFSLNLPERIMYPVLGSHLKTSSCISTTALF